MKVEQGEGQSPKTACSYLPAELGDSGERGYLLGGEPAVDHCSFLLPRAPRSRHAYSPGEGSVHDGLKRVTNLEQNEEGKRARELDEKLKEVDGGISASGASVRAEQEQFFPVKTTTNQQTNKNAFSYAPPSTRIQVSGANYRIQMSRSQLQDPGVWSQLQDPGVWSQLQDPGVWSQL